MLKLIHQVDDKIHARSSGTLKGYLMGAPTIIKLTFNHKVWSSLGQKLVITMEVKVIQNVNVITRQ